MAPRSRIDWEWIEPHWRAGIKSVLQIAADYEAETGQKVSHTAIIKHFRKLHIARDLTAKIRAKADAIVSASMVSGNVTAETNVEDAKIIDENALTIATVQLSQRKDIAKARALAQSLLDELEKQTGDLELYQQLGALLASEDGKKLGDLYHKVISLPSRVDSIKKLADTIRTLITLEREAFGMSGQTPGKTLDEFLDGLAATAS